MYERRLIKLTDPLPCAILEPGGGGWLCEKPALAAFAWRRDDAILVSFEAPGLWLLQPVCRECAEKMRDVYTREYVPVAG